MKTSRAATGGTGGSDAQPGVGRQPGPGPQPGVLDLGHQQPDISEHRSEKAQTLGLQIDDIFTALQATLGGYYVNDFNKFGRVWQVKVQGEQQDRKRFDDVYRIHAQRQRGDGADPRHCVIEPQLGAPLLARYNNYRSVTIQGGPSAGRSSGDALAAMEAISANTLPAGFGFDWTGTAFQEKEAGGKTPIVLGLAVLFRLPGAGWTLRAGLCPRRCCCP